MLEKFEAFQVASEFYRSCKKLRLPVHLQKQLERASSSIALNLAEGSGKKSQADQRRYYLNAFGSFRECQAIFKLEAISSKEPSELLARLGAMLYRLSGHPERKRQTSSVRRYPL